MGRVVTVGRGRPPLTVGERRLAVRETLRASATLETSFVFDGSLAQRRFLELALDVGHAEVAEDTWPCDRAGLGDLQKVVFRDGDEAVLVGPETVTYVRLGWGWFLVRSAAVTQAGAAAVCAAFRQAYPASYLIEAGEETRVPITFWTMGRFGPEPRLRKIDSARWDDIVGNYTAPVRAELASLMGWQEPEADGQLLLWQGPPGTGKTWALRALASQWSGWAEFHYITDPDAFFVTEPSYMINVLLSDSYAAIEQSTGDVYQEADPLGKWRVLILEDTGELLAANAKQSYGQGLSRLLNVVDGMIGQGLRVLALVTTNDELGDLHPAVARPGRCASQIEFAALTAEEAAAWYESRGRAVPADASGGTLAELYAAEHAGVDAIPEEEMVASADPELDAVLELARRPLGPTEEGIAASLAWQRDHPGERPAPPPHVRVLMAQNEFYADLARVAEEHAPDGGYGDTYWNPETATVFWNHADWTTDDERSAAEDAFLAVDAVEYFETDAECGHPGDGYSRVWPDNG